jgi:drug/metabolite transporter (DMT)-like permease
LSERVRSYQWAAVTAGFSGVLLTVAPYIGVTDHAITAATVLGVVLALLNAAGAGFAPIQIKRLSDTESTGSIVFYFSIFVMLFGLVTLPFGWTMPTNNIEVMALIGLGLMGGIGQLCLTESYRYALPSLLAPFEYASLIWSFILGYAVFGEVPTLFVVAGSLIVTAAGLFVIWRDRVHRKGAERESAAETAEAAIAAAETAAPPNSERTAKSR